MPSLGVSSPDSGPPRQTAASFFGLPVFPRYGLHGVDASWGNVRLEHFADPTIWLAGRALIDGPVVSLLGGLLHFVVAVGVTVHILINKRDVPAAIGWIGMAWLAPIVGALLYLGFGINRVRRRARRLMGSARSLDARSTGDASSADPIERLKVAIGNITGQEMATGEVAEILDSGDHGYPQMLAAIDGAKSSIRLATYIFRNDELGRQFIAALAAGQSPRGQDARADRRLRRRVSALAGLSPAAPARRSGRALPAFAPAMENAVSGPAPAQENACRRRRDGVRRRAQHRRRKPGRRRGRNRRCAIAISVVEGTIVRQIEQQFDDDWLFTTGEAPIDFHDPKPAASAADAEARVIVSGPDQETDQLVLVLLSAINAARRSDQDRHALFPARRATPDGAAIGGAARAWRCTSSCPAQIITGWSRGPPKPIFGPVACLGMQGMAQPAAVRPRQADDDRWRVEPDRQRQLGHAEPAPELRIDGGVLRSWPSRGGGRPHRRPLRSTHNARGNRPKTIPFKASRCGGEARPCPIYEAMTVRSR